MGHVLCSGWLWITSSRLAFQQCNVVFTHEYKDCLLRCHYSRPKLSSTAIQGICCTYKKVRGGGGAPKGILSINLFPMSMVSMVGSTSWWLQLLCITSFSLSALWSLTSLQKQRGGGRPGSICHMYDVSECVHVWLPRWPLHHWDTQNIQSQHS